MKKSSADDGAVLVSDFDGTMTRHDFYKLAFESLLPTDTPDYWAEYRSGAITHFEALPLYFAAIRKSEDEVLAVGVAGRVSGGAVYQRAILHGAVQPRRVA